MLYHDRSYGILGGTHAGGRGIRIDSEAYPNAVTIYFIYVSAYSTGAQIQGLYFNQYYCKCVGAGMGLYPGRPQSHGRAGKITGGAWCSGRETPLCQQ